MAADCRCSLATLDDMFSLILGCGERGGGHQDCIEEVNSVNQEREREREFWKRCTSRGMMYVPTWCRDKKSCCLGDQDCSSGKTTAALAPHFM